MELSTISIKITTSQIKQVCFYDSNNSLVQSMPVLYCGLIAIQCPCIHINGACKEFPQLNNLHPIVFSCIVLESLLVWMNITDQMQVTSLRWVSLVRYLLFSNYGLRWSTTVVYTSLAKTLLCFSSRKVEPYPLVGTFIVFTGMIRAHNSYMEWEASEGLFKEHTTRTEK